MPSTSQILQQLTLLANEAKGVALFWHVATVFALSVVLFRGWRPPLKVAAWAAAAPLLTASILAFSAGVIFNGLVLGIAVALLAVLAARLPSGRVEFGPRWTRVLGAATVTYALVYPHFVSLPTVFWSAPAGVVPCPSLGLTLGLRLLAGGFQSRAWSSTAVAFGGFYAVFGMFRLGVWLDLGLLVAAVGLFVRVRSLRRHSSLETRFA